jgi:hypothetical protein
LNYYKSLNPDYKNIALLIANCKKAQQTKELFVYMCQKAEDYFRIKTI